MITFEDVFEEQVIQNKAIRITNPLGENGRVEWTKQLLLGIISEVGEVMDRIDWKKHVESEKRLHIGNIWLEIADLFKYVISLAELWELDQDTLLRMVHHKTTEMTLRRLQQEWKPEPGTTIVVTDLDGTLADWRQSFINWVVKRGVQVNVDAANSMAIEIDLGIPYTEYIELKEQFEALGEYSRLRPIPEAVKFVRTLATRVPIVVFTARPHREFKRIWWDSYIWLSRVGICPKLLRIGSEERIQYALEMKSKGYKVIMIEDDPMLALRAAHSRLPVILRSTPYNAFVEHELIQRKEWK